MKTTLILLSFLLISTVAFAQTSTDNAYPQTAPAPATSSAPALKGAPNPFSLLDLSRIRWSHSYSISYFSGGIGSGTAGLLNSTMFYDISNSLSLAVNVGVLHNAGTIWGDGKNNATVLPGFRLDFHPSESFRLMIGVQRVSGIAPYYYDTPWYRPGY